MTYRSGERIVTEQFPVMMEKIDKFRTVLLSSEQQYRLADRALSLRYGTGERPIQARELLNVRREEDANADAWSPRFAWCGAP